MPMVGIERAALTARATGSMVPSITSEKARPTIDRLFGLVKLGITQSASRLVPPPPSSAAVAYIAAAVTLSGYTTATFGTAQAAAFTSVVATYIGVPASAITITSVTAAAAAGRHLLQSGVTVSLTVTTTTAGAGVYAPVLSSFGSASNAASLLQAAGLTACTAVALVGTVGTTATAPTAATSLPTTSLSTAVATATRTSVSPASCVAPSDCAYQCSAAYSLTTDSTGNTVTFTPTSSVPGCTCYTGTSLNTASIDTAMAVTFLDGSTATATGLSGCTLSISAVTQGVTCSGTDTIAGVSGCNGAPATSAAPATCAASVLTLAAAAAAVAAAI